MYHSNLSDKAFKDLVQILDYTIRKFGEKQKEIYKKKIIKAIHNISVMPTIGHQRIDIPPKYLVHLVGQHVIIYSVDEKAKQITISRILHSRMNFSGRL